MKTKHTTVILNAALYRNDIFNDTDKAIVEEIPVEAVSNSYLEQMVMDAKPCTGRWMRNASTCSNENAKRNRTTRAK